MDVLDHSSPWVPPLTPTVVPSMQERLATCRYSYFHKKKDWNPAEKYVSFRINHLHVPLPAPLATTHLAREGHAWRRPWECPAPIRELKV